LVDYRDVDAFLLRQEIKPATLEMSDEAPGGIRVHETYARQLSIAAQRGVGHTRNKRCPTASQRAVD
jgi:hypothetical protein